VTAVATGAVALGATCRVRWRSGARHGLPLGVAAVRLAVVVGATVCFPWRVCPVLRWCVVLPWCRRQSVGALPRATTAGTCSGVLQAKMHLSAVRHLDCVPLRWMATVTAAAVGMMGGG